ncbi:hypothetical protein TWF970_001686 [Orbilia oligospora]|uniref:BTB domain-containing protein n=1 Tax=Orbilia oligospora TaxID=2813651 RepID=A0A7C8VBC5_ORBOL|nr:hypothetical protein TWF970_001686 [Orbilia oligospora]
MSDFSTFDDTDSDSTVPGSPIPTDTNSDSPDPEPFANSDEDNENPPSTLLPIIFVTIADDYDCIVTVSSECDIRKFRVSEKILSISSPVLRNLITEAKSQTSCSAVQPESENSESKISLTLKGDPRAFGTIFEIIHYQGDDEQLENIIFDVFTQVVLLCERYEWHKALRRWTRFWLEKYEPHALEPGYENWLYIANAFKTTKHVEELSTLLGKSCGIFPAGRSPEGPGQGRFFSRNGQVVDASLWPPMTFYQD